MSRMLLSFVASVVLTFPTSSIGQDPFGSGPSPTPQAVPGKLLQPQISADPFAAPARPPVTHQPEKSPADVDADRQYKRKGLTAEQIIRQELENQTSHQFIEEPLESAVKLMGEAHDIPMVVDRAALEAIGLTPDTPVSISLKNVKLRSFLNLLLREFELTYAIEQEVLVITTDEQAEARPALRAYSLPMSIANESDKVLSGLITVVQPDTWQAKGGPSTAALVSHVLVVSARETVHESVAEYLKELETAVQDRPAMGTQKLPVQSF